MAETPEPHNYQEAELYQLAEWVAGRPWHNPFSQNDLVFGNVGECCPDFSCCVPEMFWNQEQREAFVLAFNTGDRELMTRMCMCATAERLRRMGVAENALPPPLPMDS